MSDEQVRESARYHGVTGETNILAADLLEARELIREMREIMKLNRDRLAVLGYASQTIDAALEKTKDYA